ncbi:MAG: hypothetical protein J6X08_07860 [Lachnospiraceae bacterium]|nr:hypothetical protein [Lachnospiraceae bacterium]
MKRSLFLLTAVFVMLLSAACTDKKNEEIPVVTIDASNIDEYVVTLPEYDKITVTIDKSKFSEDLTDDYINRYYERLAAEVEGLRDEEGNIRPLSEETIKLLNIPAFSSVNEFKVFVRKTVEGFIDQENEDKKINAALDIIREETVFAEIPESFLNETRERIVSRYDEIAASYDVSSDDYLELSEFPIEEETLKEAQNELIFMKLASRIGLEYHGRDEMVEGVRNYLDGIIKVSKK